MRDNFLSRFTQLTDTTDVQSTVKKISDGVPLRGFNIWILICSTILASIGLDTNSVAVIIGAMLISPLMSPILGIGLSLGMHDKELFVKSLNNLALATGISLISSALYFLFTPFGNVTEELLSRTHPTLLDVGVAFVGGIAGIVSMSRHESTNAIPGVAIATALMPPICTAGFGLATGNWEFFLGAFYLFFINALFISLSTYLIVKYLKFPVKQYVDKAKQANYTRLSWILLILSLIPSVYFLYTVYDQSKTKEKIQSLVIEPIEREGNEILKWEINPSDSIRYINIYYSGLVVADSKIDSLQALCYRNGLRSYRIKVLRVNLTREEITGLSTNVARQMLNEWQIKMLDMQKDDSINRTKWAGEVKKVSLEARVAFVNLDTISVERSIHIKDSTAPDTIVDVWYKGNRKFTEKDKDALAAFLKLRLGQDSIVFMKF